MLRSLYLLCLASLALPGIATAQTVCPGQTGAALIDCVRAAHTPSMTLSYDRARDTLYAVAHDGDRTRITDLYTGRVLPLAPGQDPTTVGCDGDKDGSSSTCTGPRTINAEHLWPQSLGASSGPARSDMHHLYPSRGDVNGARGNKPFGLFRYASASALYADTTNYTFAQAGADTLLYSANSSAAFMPRASIRGDIARAIFYFRSVYESEATSSQQRIDFFDGMCPTLLAWHNEDPADQAERDRSARVRGYQGNDNPYALDPTLAARAFDPAHLPVELVAFTAMLDGGSVRLNWQTASETNNSGFDVQATPAESSAFRSLGWVNGRGTTLEAHAYSFRATDLTPGAYRFRLHQIDLDGASEFSPVVELVVPGSLPLSLASTGPNPFSTSTSVTVSTNRAQKVRVSMHDVLGREVVVLHEGSVNGSLRMYVVGAELPAGVYVVRAQGESHAVAQVLTRVR